MRHKKVNKIKRMTQVIKDMTLLLKSFKGMIEVIFYIFLMCYVGYDKISVYSRVKVIEKIEVDSGLDNSVNPVIEQVSDGVYDIDYMGIGVVGVLFIMVVYKVIVMIKDRK